MPVASHKDDALIRRLKQLCDQAERLTKTSRDLCAELNLQIRDNLAHPTAHLERRQGDERRRTKRQPHS